jgi:uncharacterized protein (TIGR02117 family)
VTETGDRSRRILVWTLRVLGALFALPIAYLLAAGIGSHVSANRAWKQPRQGITIFVETNGVHTWIAMPTISPEMDWRPIVPAEHIRDPRYAGEYVAFGYGNREFYLNTPEWKDLTFGRALHAAFGNGPTLMHVYHERHPRADPDRVPIRLTSAQYRALAGFLLQSFARDASGRSRPLLGRGFGKDDVFYEARGGYNLIYTCNEWTGSALRTAGVRIGYWTPFAPSIMAPLRSRALPSR